MPSFSPAPVAASAPASTCATSGPAWSKPKRLRWTACGSRRQWPHSPKPSADLPQPVIAAVNGPCVGAGFALCLAADIRICSTAASFGNGAILLGLSGAEMGMSYHLPRIVGTSVAADWMLTGRTVSAAEADRRGLVSEVVEPDRLDRTRPRAGRADRRPGPAGCATDQACAAGQHRRAQPRVGAGLGEPQSGDLARDRRGRRTPQKVVVVTGPLKGVRIVTMGGLGPAPFCGMLLGDLGRRRDPDRSRRRVLTVRCPSTTRSAAASGRSPPT